MLPRPYILLLLLIILISSVSCQEEEANRIVNLLKLSLQNNNIGGAQSIIARSFEFNDCNSVVNYDQFIGSLRLLASPPLSVSLDMSISKATFTTNQQMSFVLHFNDQSAISYSDIEFTAQKSANHQYILTSGTSMGCRQTKSYIADYDNDNWMLDLY